MTLRSLWAVPGRPVLMPNFLSRLVGSRRPPAPGRAAAGMAAPLPGSPHGPRLMAPGEAFTPTQPKHGRRRLIGRDAELQRILQALREDRAHVVLYSERGRGKTSLSNLVVEALRRTGSIVARHTCEAGSTFDSLMRGLMRDLPPSLLAVRAEGMSGDDPAFDTNGCEAALPAHDLRPRDVVTLPQRLACRDLVCVIDEFDRVEDAATRTRLADTIKQLSDQDVPLLFLIVGVSENLEEILGQHPSIQRAVLGVHLPLFTDHDVAQLISRGARETGLVFEPAAVARITVLARGMPYMAQLLALRLSQAAAARGDNRVLEEDFDTAVARMLNDGAPRVLALYASLSVHGQDMEMVQALRRVATAPQDGWGRLLVTEARDGSVSVGGRSISLACWERLAAAQVLVPTMPGSGLFLFGERGLIHHVLLLAAHDAALPELIVAAQGAEAPAAGNETTAGASPFRILPARTRLASMSRG